MGELTFQFFWYNNILKLANLLSQINKKAGRKNQMKNKTPRSSVNILVRLNKGIPYTVRVLFHLKN